MKAIYDAVRALLYPGNAQHKAGSQYPWPQAVIDCPLEVRRTLNRFELRNRGSRHLLSTPGLSTVPPKRLDHADVKRRATLFETTRSVLVDLLTYTAQACPSSLDALLDAPDTSGWLQALAFEKLRWYYGEIASLKDKSDYGVRLFHVEHAAQGTGMRVELQSRTQPLAAGRLLPLPAGDCTTLRATLDFIRQAQASLQEQLADVDSWPEFNTTRRDQARLAKIRDDLHNMVCRYPAETRRLLVENWQALCPLTKV